MDGGSYAGSRERRTGGYDGGYNGRYNDDGDGGYRERRSYSSDRGGGYDRGGGGSYGSRGGGGYDRY